MKVFLNPKDHPCQLNCCPPKLLDIRSAPDFLNQKKQNMQMYVMKLTNSKNKKSMEFWG